MSEIPPPTIPPATPPPPGGGSYTPPPPPPSGGGYGGGGGGYTPPPTSGAGDRTLMIVLAYIWILFLIPLLTKKEDPEVQWHAKNGMGITIGEFGAWVIYWIIVTFAPSIIGCAVGVLSCIIGIGFFVLRIICIIKGINGQRFTVPVLTDLGTKLNI